MYPFKGNGEEKGTQIDLVNRSVKLEDLFVQDDKASKKIKNF